MTKITSKLASKLALFLAALAIIGSVGAAATADSADARCGFDRRGQWVGRC